LEEPRNHMGQDVDCIVNVQMRFHQSTFSQAKQRIQFRFRPMQFLGFSNHEKGALRQESLKWSTVCSTFLRSGWITVRSALLAKRDISKQRPWPHHKFLTWSNKVSPQTLQMVLTQWVGINYFLLWYHVMFETIFNKIGPWLHTIHIKIFTKLLYFRSTYHDGQR
jgi:hypothetical protein